MDGIELSQQSHGSEAELLVAGIISRDPRALQSFHMNYGTFVERCISSLLRNPDDAHDCYLELLIDLHQKMQSYDATKGTLGVWLRAVAKNAARKFSQTSRSTVSLTHPEDYLIDCVAPDQPLFENGFWSEVYRIFDHFSNDRAVHAFYLKFVHRYSYAEIVTELTLASQDHARTLVHRGRTRLQKEIKQRVPLLYLQFFYRDFDW